MFRGASGVPAGAWASAGRRGARRRVATGRRQDGEDRRDEGSPHGASLPAIPGRRYHALAASGREPRDRAPGSDAVRRLEGARVVRVVRGILGAIRAHPRVFLVVAVTVVGLSILAPPALLSIARRPVDYFTFNPWLKRLPAYVVSPTIPLAQKLEKLPALALFWFSSDSPYGGTEWGFAVDVTDAARILLLAGLFGAYFALLARRRAACRSAAAGMAAATRRGGVAGMLTSVVGLSTGPCSVMGCGAPVLPVVGLAFAGLSSGTLAFLAGLSRVTTLLVFLALVGGRRHAGLAGRARLGTRPPIRRALPSGERLPRSRIPLQQVRDRVAGARAARRGGRPEASAARCMPRSHAYICPSAACSDIPLTWTRMSTARALPSSAICARSRSWSASEVAVPGPRSIS